MAVTTVPKTASQFWPSFYKKTLLLVMLAQILIAAAVGALLIGLGVFTIDSTLMMIIVGGLALGSVAINAIIFLYAIRPVRDLLSVIIHVSGEKPELSLPNMNTKKYEKTGFSDALKTVYELASKQQDGTSNTDKPSTAPSTLSSALDMTTCGFVTLNHSRLVTYANKAAPVHVGTDGKPVIDLIFTESDSLNKWLDDCDEHAVHAEHIWTRIPNKLPNEEDRRFFDVIASYEKGSEAETVLSLVDRTSLYIVDEENLDFIAFAAHELRGPTTVIRGYLDVLNDELEGVLKNDQKELFRRLIISSNRLSGYIDNILNTSRYDRRHLKVHLTENTVAAVYDIVSDDMQLRAGAQNRLLTVSLPADLPTVAVDKNSMSEVFSNLIDNAIKYSNEGGVINVTAAVNGDFVDVSFQDHGIGMPESVVANLFQKFYRSHRSRETVAGTGIGLYICKAIVESHGGTISVRSEDGKGSTFIVSIPIYSKVAEKLKAGDNSNEGLISEGRGWIKNHSMYRS